MSKPVHEHDCTKCEFIGRLEDENVDVYFCDGKSIYDKTLIGRKSSEGRNYYSMDIHTLRENQEQHKAWASMGYEIYQVFLRWRGRNIKA